MKHSIFLLCCLFTLACSKKLAVTTAPPAEKTATETIPAIDPTPIMTFEERLLHLGKVKKGDQIPLSYTFTNTGDADLEIDLISVCDCTKILERPYKAIKPGESGIIKAVFDSNQKDEAETIDIDIWLKHMDLELDMPKLERIQYTYEFE